MRRPGDFPEHFAAEFQSRRADVEIADRDDADTALAWTPQ
ncbi:hypothetical protein D779_1030 [Imhoffiella purpurea]|uniref:Uncharacterized protein n=1 Tax=Imhoffiella purpurea TaxID=1249627 RepID=W9VFN5_9GAMM|nr:hypothetical protein D779_1030 [Imhoffiella purpurea]